MGCQQDLKRRKQMKRMVLVLVCCIAMASSLGVVAKGREKISISPSPSLSNTEMKHTVGKGATCSGTDCEGTPTCENLGLGHSNYTQYFAHSTCQASIWPGYCDNFALLRCTQVTYCDDESCTVAALSTSENQNPQIYPKYFCGN